jgi:Pyridine nucleotide-disulphide oxidoreductase, dimerisation domain
MTGASEKTLRRANRPFRKIYVHPANHAAYYPGAESMTLKLLFGPQTGKILGAQAVGGAGVDKRIDVLAVAIQAGMTVFDLEEMELAYSPQYGSAKDPVNMAGFVAAGLLRGDHTQVDAEAILAATQGSSSAGCTHAKGVHGGAHSRGRQHSSRRTPFSAERTPNLEIAVYCQVGQRGYLATRILLQAGFRAANVAGGLKTYQLFNPNSSSN